MLFSCWHPPATVGVSAVCERVAGPHPSVPVLGGGHGQEGCPVSGLLQMWRWQRAQGSRCSKVNPSTLCPGSFRPGRGNGV